MGEGNGTKTQQTEKKVAGDKQLTRDNNGDTGPQCSLKPENITGALPLQP